METIKEKCDNLETKIEDLHTIMSDIKESIRTKTIIDSAQLADIDDIKKVLVDPQPSSDLNIKR